MTTLEKTPPGKTPHGKTALGGTPLDGAVRRCAMAFACLVLVMVAGCARQPDPAADSVTPEFSLSGTASPKPAVSATGSLSARDQQIAAGTEAIRAYRQMIFDIYADPSPNVQDMRKVATGGQLTRDLRNLARNLDEGWVATSGTVEVKWVKPVKIGKREMQLYSCVDPNGIVSSRGGQSPKPAQRYAVDYLLTLSQESWLVSAVYGHGDNVGGQSC